MCTTLPQASISTLLCSYFNSHDLFLLECRSSGEKTFVYMNLTFPHSAHYNDMTLPPLNRYKQLNYIREKYGVCPEGIQSCTMKNRDSYWRRHKIQETLHTGQWHLSALQSRCFGTSHSSLVRHHLPCCIFLTFIGGLKSLHFQRWFSFQEKPEVTGHQIWAVGAWIIWVIWCFATNSAQDVMREQACCCDEAANHQLPIAAAFWIIQIVWIVSKEECSSLTQNLMQIRCSTHSVILNVMATQYTCSLDGVSHPHGLAQWSHHCWCTFQSTLLGYQVTSMLHNPFSIY